MKRIVIRMGYLLLLSAAYAQNSAYAADSFLRPLTLAECLSRAETRNENLRIQAGKQDEAAARLRQARGGVQPDLRFQAAHLMRDTAGDTIDGDQSDARFTVNQPLYAGKQRIKSIDLAHSEIQKEKHVYDDINRDVREQVIAAFYLLARLDAARANIQDTAQSLSVRLKELNGRVQLGKSRESEALMTESQLAALNAQYEKTGGDRATAVELLSFLTDAPPSGLTIYYDTTTVSGLQPLESYIEKMYGRADILAARQALISQSLRVGIASGGLLPALAFTGSWYTLRDGSLENSDWEALLSLDVPLFQGGRTRGRISEEKARQYEAEQTVSRLTRAAATLVRTRYAATAASIREAAAYTDAFVKAQKNYQMQLRDYRYGLVNNLDVIQALASMLDVKQSMDTALIQAKRDKTLLEEAVR